MTNWQINLQPLDDFYFGGERNFSFGADDPQLGANYFSRSNHLPQQTALLGMLRKELLRQNNQLPITDHAKASGLIGDESFNTEQAGTFGKIGRLSPVMLFGNGEYYFPAQRRFSRKTQENAPVLTADIHLAETGKAWFHPTGESSPLYRIDGFDYKGGFEEGFSPKGSPGTHLRLTDIFDELERVGIQKHALRKPGTKETEDGYYKLASFKFKKDLRGFSFCCFVECEIEITSGIVFLGGEQSPFKMTVTKAPTDFDFEHPNVFFGETAENDFTSIVLLSDACLPASVLDECAFSINDAVEFRNFRTAVNKTKHFDKMLSDQHALAEAPVRGKKMNLLKRGSILVFSDSTTLNKVADDLKSSHFRSIGYNYFIKQ